MARENHDHPKKTDGCDASNELEPWDALAFDVHDDGLGLSCKTQDGVGLWGPRNQRWRVLEEVARAISHAIVMAARISVCPISILIS